MAQSILFNTGIALFGRVATLALGLGATALMTRIVSVADFGLYSLIATIGTFFQLIADFGLYLTASRELGRGPKGNALFGHIVSLRAVLLMGIYGVAGVFLFAVPSFQHLAPLFAVFAVGFVSQSISQLFMSVFQALGIVWKATIGDIIGRVAQIAVLIVLFQKSTHGYVGPIGIASAFAAGLVVSFLIQLFYVPNKAMLLPKVRVETWKRLLGVSFPIAMLLVLNAIYFRIDTVMLAMFRSSQEVGWYALAYKVIEHTLFFPAMLGGLVLPHLGAALEEKDTSRARGFVSQSLLLSLSFAVPMVGIFVLYAPQLVVLISGSAFKPSGPILAVLAWAAGIMFVGNILGFALIALKKQKELLIVYTLLAVGNIVANMYYIPSFGALGAAWVTVVTEGIATAVASFLVFKDISWRISLGSVMKIIIVTIVASIVGLSMPAHISILLRVLCICATYALLGYTVGMWGHATTYILRSAKRV